MIFKKIPNHPYKGDHKEILDNVCRNCSNEMKMNMKIRDF